MKLKIFFQFIIDFFSIYLSSFKVRTIFFFPFYHTGGAEKVHLDIVRSIGAKKSIVIITDDSYNCHFLKDFKEISYVYELHRYLNNIYYRKVLSILFKNIGIHNKLSTFGCNSKYYYKILPILNKNIYKVDLLHAFSYSEFGMEIFGMEIYSLPYVNYLNKRIVINNKTKLDFKMLYIKNHINLILLNRFEIINNATEISNLITKKEYSNNKLSVIYLGRISEEKRVHICIKIAKKLKENIIFKIYGPKLIELEDLNKYYIKNLNSEADIKCVYKESDILLITSYREGFPMVIMEAMANGVVCISTDVGGINEHITNGVNGFLVKNHENEQLIINEFVEILNNLSNNHFLLEKISNNAYEYAKNNFSFKKFNNHYKSILIR